METVINQWFSVTWYTEGDKQEHTQDFDNYKDAKAKFESLAINQETGEVNEDVSGLQLCEYGEYVEGGEPTGEFTPYEVLETWRV